MFPNDVQTLDAVEEPPHEHGTVHSGVGYSPPRILPTDADLDRAAEVLNSGKRVAMLVGAGALHATDEVLATADVLGAGIAKALLGLAAVPSDVPHCTGSIGLLGTMPSWVMMQECDTLLMVGSNFPYSEFLPKEGQARGIQIELDARLAGIRYPMELNLIGDSAETLRALLPRLERKTERGWQERIARAMKDWDTLLERRALTSANPINPQHVFRALSRRLPDDCIITADSGSGTNWFARDLKLRRGMMASLSGNLATMGPGAPYALAAKMAFPERPVIACVGDGAMQMNGQNVLLSIAKYREEWADPRFIVLVLNNRDLNQVTWEQRVMEGDPKFDASQDLPDGHFAEYAELIGLRGLRVERPEQVEGALDAALLADRPCVLDVLVDPSVPPLPPHISFEQAKNFVASMLRGDPDLGSVLRRSLSNLFPSFAGGNTSAPP